MNRKQARIYSKLTKEEVKELRPNFNTECYEIMKAFAAGAQVTFMDVIRDTPTFDFSKSEYQILPEAHIVNGREVPMPLRVKPMSGEEFWVINNTSVFRTVWGDSSVDNRLFKLGNFFATEKDAQANFNAMWKVEE